MSLKINIIYKGIIYKVKGIKVLCSVVLAVVILLAAIVGMGVWMLVNAYDPKSDDASTTAPITAVKNNITKNDNLKPESSRAPFIDFKTADHVVPSSIVVQDARNQRFIVDKEVIPQTNFHDTRKKEPSTTESQSFSEYPEQKDTRVPEKEATVYKVNTKDTDGWRQVTRKEQPTPVRPIPQITNNNPTTTNLNNRDDDPTYTKYHDLEYTNKKIVERIGLSSGGSEEPKERADPENKFRAKLRTLTRIPISSNPDIRRKDEVTPESKLKYLGPPVVGYGTNPYTIMTQNRIQEYDEFWRNYVEYSKTETKQSTDFVPSKPINGRGSLRAHLRGLRPSKEEYDLPVRPDAQTPSKINLSEINTQSRSDPAIIAATDRKTNPSPPQLTNRPFVNPNRRLLARNQTQINSLPQPLHRPGVASNPLQELYDYSKKLAASLLSFNSKSPVQIRESSQKLAEYGINLIESHNNVFKHATKGNGPLQRIVSLIPTADRLKSLDAFELSLVTWTFLDFWEFLIEKVGTLSDEDLSLLQQRLERLRKKKDDAMTRVFVNETLTKYSAGSQRRFSDTASPHLKNHQQIPDIHKANNNNKEGEDKGTLPQEGSQLKKEHILGNLFPSIVKKQPDETKQDQKSHTESIQDRIHQSQNSNTTISAIHALLRAPIPYQAGSPEEPSGSSTAVDGRSMWDPLGIFTSQGRMEFMQFAVKVLFNFGKVYLKKPYALDCSMLLFCKDLNQNTRRGGIQAMAAKLKSVGLKVLTESEQQLREADTFREVWRSITAWTPLQCDVMFPRCDGPKALEIVNEVALGTN